MTTPRFTPTHTPGGGTPTGNSYLSSWAECPRLWFNNYYRPTHGVDGVLLGRGIETPHRSPPLLTGTTFHAGLAAWYTSGVHDGEDTGERSLDHAIELARAQHQAHSHQYALGTAGAEGLKQVETALYAYHDRYGPGSQAGPEYPEITVLCDSQGQPLIERDWAFPIAPGYQYTCRTDLIVLHHGYVKAMEHKFVSASAYTLRNMVSGAGTASQYTGEYATLAHCLPDLTLSGVMLNLVQKDRAPRSKYDAAVRETTSRTTAQIDRWRRSAVSILGQIDAAVSSYEEGLAQGDDPEALIDVCFPDYGTRTDRCTKYNGCEFLGLCSLAGMEHRGLAQYRVRNPSPTEAPL